MRALPDFQHRDETSLIVMESTFVSYHRVARRTLSGFWLTWPFSPLAYVLISDGYSAEDALVANKIPLLVIHDKKDPSVSFANGEEIYKLATAPKKEFWQFELGGHLTTFETRFPQNRKRYIEFLDSL
jgi:fermentation-respiration switch protein FrsA (DUF1100 family)